jgi:hypothetical protein
MGNPCLQTSCGLGSVFLSLADPSRACNWVFIRFGATEGGAENSFSQRSPSKKRRLAATNLLIVETSDFGEQKTGCPDPTADLN